MKISDNTTVLEILEEEDKALKLKFPSIEVPVTVSRRYFNKIKNSGAYMIKETKKASWN